MERKREEGKDQGLDTSMLGGQGGGKESAKEIKAANEGQPMRGPPGECGARNQVKKKTKN